MSPSRKTEELIAEEAPAVSLRACEERLRAEARSALGALVAGVAHEVRNPLFGITATLDALEANLGRPEELPQYVRVLREQLRRLTDLTQDLLDYGRPVRLDLRAGSLRSAAAQAAEEHASLVKKRRVTLVSRIPEDLPRIPFDQGRMVLVFRNLLENAVLHSSPGGSVMIDAGPSLLEGARGVECAVADAGPGFLAADLPRVFQPFFARRRGGTGLGLSIVQRIVEEHGGRVFAANRPEGGARVFFFLPAGAAGPGAEV